MKRKNTLFVTGVLITILMLCINTGCSSSSIEDETEFADPIYDYVLTDDSTDYPTVSGDPLFSLHILVAQGSQIAITRANWLSSNLHDIGIEAVVDELPWSYWVKSVLYSENYGLERPSPSGSPEWVESSHLPHFRQTQYDGEGVMYCAGYESEYDHWNYYSTQPGYGTFWEDWLTKPFHLPSDPVSLTYSIQYDTEPVYDTIQVQISCAKGDWETLISIDGCSIGFETHELDLDSYAGQDVNIRFRFSSDGGYSDEDGQLDTDGACRIDWVEVTGYPRDDFTDDNDGWIASTPPQLAIQGFDIAIMGLGSAGYDPGLELGTLTSNTNHGYYNPLYEFLIAELDELDINWNENYPDPPVLGEDAIDILEQLQHIWVEDQPFWVLWGRDNIEVGDSHMGWSVALLNHANPNIAETVVRQAMSLAIDRVGMREVASAPWDRYWDVQTPMLPVIPGFDPLSYSTQYSYGSVIKARKMLYDAGYTDIIIPDSDMDGWNDYDELFFIFSDPFDAGPFYIDGDDELAAMAAWHEWVGDGTEEHPYIIKGYSIDVNDADVSCIEIRNIQSKYFIIRDCTVQGATAPNMVPDPPYPNMHAGIHLHNVIGAQVTNNLAFGNLEGIFLNLSKSCLVNDNECRDNSWNGIILVGSCVENVIINNYFHHNSFGGIELWKCSENVVSSNLCSFNTQAGISLFESPSNTISGNTLSDNDVWGICVHVSCFDCLVEDNNCTGNEIGIYVFYPGFNDIIHNNCSGNDYGIFLNETQQNFVYHNYLIDNGVQAVDIDEFWGGLDFWYNPELLEGNVWSDYIGVDFDRDGIGDTDIPWPGEGYDPYPLVTDDFDNDGLSYYGELVIGTDPYNDDSDGDFFKDGDEWRFYFTDPLTFDTPQEVSEVIDSNLEELVDEGVLEQNDVTPLIRKLDAARDLMDRGKLFQATQKLRDFISQINAMINRGQLSEEEGYALIAIAQALIDVILTM